MSVALLDVNVLVALFDPAHTSHEEAHRWFGMNRSRGWATCPLTVNGCIQILSNPAYTTVEATPAEVVKHLREFCATPHHHFWPDSVSMTDDLLFRWPSIDGHRKITDVYLLGLAVRNHGRLVTFDRSIPLKVVNGAEAENLVVLGSR
ncbi:MAG: VapC toxin family PIN domain ribonuclease [Bryobacterales bacterium]|nr:VapC toxin family PIN domain ribonuclease [Bryobacterales bacterium]